MPAEVLSMQSWQHAMPRGCSTSLITLNGCCWGSPHVKTAELLHRRGWRLPTKYWFKDNHMYLDTCEKVAENGDLGGCFLHAFHRTLSCRAILKYNTVPPLPQRHPLPHRSLPQHDSSNSLLHTSPE